MADHRERVAERLRLELGRRGEQPKDLAYRIDVTPRTVERWLAGERQPQGRHLKAVSDDLGVPIEELNPDLAAEDQAIREWMERIERKLELVDEIKDNQLAIVDQVAAILMLTQAIQAVTQTLVAPSEGKRPARSRSRQAG